MKRLIFLSLALCLLCGCSEFWKKTWNGWVYDEKPPFIVNGRMPQTERWCYRSLGRIECYEEIQDYPPDTLVAVDPPSLQPMSHEDYKKALARAQAKKNPQTVPPILPPPVIKAPQK